MTNLEAQEWFADEIYYLHHLTRLTAPQRKKLAAYEAAMQALKIAEADSIRPYWYGKLNERY